MISQEYDGLKRLKIPLVRWGNSFRIKIRNQHGITTFISSVNKPSNVKLISKYYKISEERVKKAVEYEYRAPKTYTPFYNDVLESHEFYGYSQDEIYEKVREFLLKQTKGVKVNIQLGYRLIDRTNLLERDYWTSSNTYIWDKPIAVNSKRDVDAKIMSYMHAKDFTERISYPASAYQLKEINSAKIVIFYRNHVLGDSNIVIPDFIKNNSFGRSLIRVVSPVIPKNALASSVLLSLSSIRLKCSNHTAVSILCNLTS
ncbi:unnamed protein product [Phytophthora lilii]|uniref:Unnamed protein product n=1 Tax=Phytophthora lilii TaxID=2077276 RepID=A0A9W6TYE0_9STRA|nr:unnamed protein product [Phytophthora lilii]